MATNTTETDPKLLNTTAEDGWRFPPASDSPLVGLASKTWSPCEDFYGSSRSRASPSVGAVERNCLRRTTSGGDGAAPVESRDISACYALGGGAGAAMEEQPSPAFCADQTTTPTTTTTPTKPAKPSLPVRPAASPPPPSPSPKAKPNKPSKADSPAKSSKASPPPSISPSPPPYVKSDDKKADKEKKLADAKAKAEEKKKAAEEKRIAAQAKRDAAKAAKAEAQAARDAMLAKVKDENKARRAALAADAAIQNGKLKRFKTAMRALSKTEACASMCEKMGLNCTLIVCEASDASTADAAAGRRLRLRALSQTTAAGVEYAVEVYVNTAAVDADAAAAKLTAAGVTAEVTEEDPLAVLAAVPGITADDVEKMKVSAAAAVAAEAEAVSAETQAKDAEAEVVAADAEVSAAEKEVAAAVVIPTTGDASAAGRRAAPRSAYFFSVTCVVVYAVVAASAW